MLLLHPSCRIDETGRCPTVFSGLRGSAEALRFLSSIVFIPNKKKKSSMIDDIHSNQKNQIGALSQEKRMCRKSQAILSFVHPRVWNSLFYTADWPPFDCTARLYSITNSVEHQAREVVMCQTGLIHQPVSRTSGQSNTGT